MADLIIPVVVRFTLKNKYAVRNRINKRNLSSSRHALKVHHIGIVVKNIDDAAEYWKRLGCKIDHRQIVESQSVEVAFLSLGDIWLELIQPAAEKTPVTNFLEKRGEGLHHICVQVDNIMRATDGVRLIADPAQAFGDSKVAFAYPKEFGKVLVEFVENPPY